MKRNTSNNANNNNKKKNVEFHPYSDFVLNRHSQKLPYQRLIRKYYRREPAVTHFFIALKGMMLSTHLCSRKLAWSPPGGTNDMVVVCAIAWCGTRDIGVQSHSETQQKKAPIIAVIILAD